MNNKFAERLSEFLREEKISQRQFAATIGVTAACVSYWRSGKKQPTSSPRRRIFISSQRHSTFRWISCLACAIIDRAAVVTGGVSTHGKLNLLFEQPPLCD